jgi:hypothetical protein
VTDESHIFQLLAASSLQMLHIYCKSLFTFTVKMAPVWQFNPLEPELSTHATLEKTHYLNQCPLCCMFLANDFSGHLVFSTSQCTPEDG